MTLVITNVPRLQSIGLKLPHLRFGWLILNFKANSLTCQQPMVFTRRSTSFNKNTIMINIQLSILDTISLSIISIIMRTIGDILITSCLLCSIEILMILLIRHFRMTIFMLRELIYLNQALIDHMQLGDNFNIILAHSADLKML